MALVTFDLKNKVGLLTIHRPEALNALNEAVLEELEDVLTDIERKKEIHCLVITGSGEKAFVAGADIKEMQNLSEGEAFVFSQKGHAVFNKIENLYCPVIAAVNGFALGGGLELALACDFIMASSKAKMGLPECTLGVIPGFGGTIRLERRVGSGFAKQWTFTGAMVTADEALRAGLVNSIIEPETFMADVMKMAETISSRSPKALAMIKKSINGAYGQPTDKAVDMEAKYFSMTFGPDQKEGMTAFLEKRPPQFKSPKDMSL